MTTNASGWIFEDRVLPTSHLSQGDLIAFENSEPLRRYGLVVTADCDLENRKHGRLVTLVPVVELVDIVEYYLLLEHCDRQRDSLLGLVGKIFQVDHQLSLAEDVAELRLKISERASDDKWATECLAARLILHEVDRLTVAQYKAVMEMAGVKVGNLAKKFEGQIGSKGDILVLPSLANAGINANIAWVRPVWQLPLRSVVFRTSQVSADNGQRVARLDSPFRYRLTQLMAQVFSDIGLPDLPSEFTPQLEALCSK